jgi:hypothetical protein
MQFALVASLVLILSPGCFGGNHYWWMSNPSVFSSGNQGGNSKSSGTHSQQQQQQQQQQTNYAPSQNVDRQGWMFYSFFSLSYGFSFTN